MRQLTIEHLAPYLPYGLKVSVNNTEYKMTCDDNIYHVTLSIIDTIEGLAKPILGPLSDLTKEIEHNGERFVPIEKLLHIAQENLYGYKIDSLFKIISGESFSTEDSWAFIQHSERGRNAIFYRQTNQFRWFEYMVDGDIIRIDELALFQKLFEWHFDVYRLIPDNLAIDINKI